MQMRRTMIALLAALAMAAPALLAGSQEDWSQPTKKWIRGPVRCLVTDEEEKAFKRLKTEEEITQFVKDFWARRDPTPDTPVNEFAEHFWSRVDEADKRFIQTTDSGAMSDRGQIFILFGMPSRTESGKNMEWFYEDVPDITPSSFTIRFGPSAGGNFLLLGKKGVREIANSNEFLRGLGEKAKEIFAPPPVVAEALPSALEYGAAPEVETEESKILDSLGGSDILPSAIPLQIRTDIYRATGGDSFIAVTLGVARADAGSGNLVGFARIIPDAADVATVTLAAADSFAPAAENANPATGILLYQGGTGLHPGRYTLLAAIRDPESGKTGAVRQILEVPEYGGGSLMLSTVALVRKLERPKTVPNINEGKKPAFFLGSFRVVPSLDGVFRQGSELAWYYQIYNAAPEAATGQPNLTIEYNFLLKQKGEYRPVTAPVVEKNRPSQIGAFALPLIKPTPTQKGWVEGEYKVTIKVTDEVAQSNVSTELPFQVVP